MSQYGNYFSDPAEMEKYKEKIRLRNLYKNELPEPNSYPYDYYTMIIPAMISEVVTSKQEYPYKGTSACYLKFKRINVNGANGIFKQWEADI